MFNACDSSGSAVESPVRGQRIRQVLFRRGVIAFLVVRARELGAQVRAADRVCNVAQIERVSEQAGRAIVLAEFEIDRPDHLGEVRCNAGLTRQLRLEALRARVEDVDGTELDAAGRALRIGDAERVDQERRDRLRLAGLRARVRRLA
jgi:hypothetical protein